jgi:SAM-dependent methyltransferase
VLDIGCGAGELSLLLALRGARVTGLDLDESRLARGRLLATRLGAGRTCAFVHGDAESVTLPERSIDVVISKSTLQYVERRRVLERCLAALTPDGALALNENLPHNPFIRAFRCLREARARLGSGADYARSIKGYFSFDDLRWLERSFRSVEHREHHLARVLVRPSVPSLESRAARRLDGAATRLDGWLLDRAPAASRYAWLTSVVARGPLEAVQPSRPEALGFTPRSS